MKQFMRKMEVYSPPNYSQILPIIDLLPPPPSSTLPIVDLSPPPPSLPLALSPPIVNPNPNPPSLTNPAPIFTYFAPPPPHLPSSPPPPPPTSLPITQPPTSSTNTNPNLPSSSPLPSTLSPPLPSYYSPPPTSSCHPPLALPSPLPPSIAPANPPPSTPPFALPPPPSIAPIIPPPPPPLSPSPPQIHVLSPPRPLAGPPPPPPPLSKPVIPSTTMTLPTPVHSPTRPRASNLTANGHLGLKHSSSRSNGVVSGATVTIAALAGLMMLSFVGVGVWFVRHRKRTPAAGYDMPAPGGISMMPDLIYSRTPSFPLVRIRHSSGGYGYACSPSDPGLGNSTSWFTYEDLSFVTNGFSAENLLGQGGFGPVYKGTLLDGREVAVKQLKVGGSQGEREFGAEVEIISRIHHRHLVSLVGYCMLENQRLLVYDYVPNKTLYYHLHGDGRPVMEWATRVKVAIGSARGIAYLHEDCHPRIIHRDIKSSNILLDNNFEAKVSDFGLARLVMDTSTHVTTRVMGTFGYLAPEYASSGKLSAKSDVYSFGVVVLELITGRKPVDVSQHLGDESLVEWARPLLSRALENGDIGELPDPRLEKRYNHREMFQMIEAAAACVRHSAAMRPRMGQVVRALGNLFDLDLTNGVRPGLSEVFSSGPDTEEIEIFQRTWFTSQD